MTEHESWIEEWFFDHRDDVTLLDFFCRDHVLQNTSAGCLNEPMPIESSQNLPLESLDSDGMSLLMYFHLSTMRN